MKSVTDLERLAVAAHTRGDTWATGSVLTLGCWAVVVITDSIRYDW